MSTSIDDLVTFLKARFDEDEITLSIQNENLSGHDRPFNPTDPTDPAHVLCDLKIKQWLLTDLYSRYKKNVEFPIGILNVLAALAQSYDWHPDYSLQWSCNVRRIS